MAQAPALVAMRNSGLVKRRPVAYTPSNLLDEKIGKTTRPFTTNSGGSWSEPRRLPSMLYRLQYRRKYQAKQVVGVSSGCVNEQRLGGPLYFWFLARRWLLVAGC